MAIVLSTGTFDRRLAEGRPVVMSSVDIDNASKQETIDTLSVLVLHLRDENARMNSTMAALLAQQNPSTQPETRSTAKSIDDVVKPLATTSAEGEP